MPDSADYREIERARATRFETLELVDGLDQEQIDFAAEEGSWSLGQVLDHLIKTDGLYFKNIHRLVARKKAGKTPFIYRGISSVMSMPKPLRLVAPLFEVPFAVPNSLLPSALRHKVGANRKLPLKAPDAFIPRADRPIAELREDLHKLIDDLDLLEKEDMDLRKLYYYNPVLGLATVPGAIEFLAVHEERHQGQLREILSSPEFPRAA